MAGKAKGKSGGRNGGTTIVIRREEVSGGGHHGGAWKVAYADFVTAMMAFFLLMWLINATSEEQRRGLADYFAPTNVLGRTVSGSGQPFGGRTQNSEGELASDAGAVRVEKGAAPTRLDIEEDEEHEAVPPETAEARVLPAALPLDANGGPGATAGTRMAADTGTFAGLAAVPTTPSDTMPPATPTTATHLPDRALRAELARRERAAFEQAAEEIRAAVQDDPALADLARQLMVEQVPEGLRIQLVDSDRQPMFPIGGAAPNERARALLQKVLGVAARLPNPLAIAGHTDATPFRGADRTNWELSTERANAVRRLLADGGIAEQRIETVTGHAERSLLLPDQPTAAANRRVAVTLLRRFPLAPDALAPPGASPRASPGAAAR